MHRSLTAVLAALSFASAAFAAPIKLTPASPQPSGLKQGLAVEYAFPPDVKTIKQAEKALRKAKKGAPLAGLDYRDTEDGMDTLTSGKAHHVAARITGYVRFDAPGVYIVDMVSNDGVKLELSGKEVVYFDDRHPCEPSFAAEVEVPQAGWYDLEAVYFQRTGTACLHMRAGIGKQKWMENESFGYK